MNAATFRALRETCGYPQSGVAERLGVRTQTVKNWEKGLAPVPPDAAEWMFEMLDEHDELVSQAVDSTEAAFRDLGVEAGCESPVRLTYWRTQAEYDERGRDPGGEAGVVNARSRAIAQVLRDLEYDVEFAYYDESAVRTPGSRY